MPDWYATLVTAKDLGIPPWQLDGIEPATTDIAVLEFWKQKSLIAKTAENQAMDTKNNIASKFGGKGKKPRPDQQANTDSMSSRNK